MSNWSEPPLTVAAVARRLGVAPATLRTWDRRYGLGPSDHNSGQHRRYSTSDLAKLTLMRRLIISGVSPAEAAAKAKREKPKKVSSNFKVSKKAANQKITSQTIQTLLKAARGMDRTVIEALLQKEISRSGSAATWNAVVVPLLIELGEEWAESNLASQIASEHLLTEILKRIFGQQQSLLRTPVNARPVLLASVGEELHTLALRALGAALAENKIETHFLGARTPFAAIAEVVRKSAPPAIFLWAQLPENADERFITELPNVRPAPRLVIGGPGWHNCRTDGAIVAQDLSDAVNEIAYAVGL